MKHPIEKAAEVAGSEKALADHLGVTKAAVWQWKQPGRRTPIEHCAAIERLCGHAVTRRELRPDDWQAIWPELAQAGGVPASGPVTGAVPGSGPGTRHRTANTAKATGAANATNTVAPGCQPVLPAAAGQGAAMPPADPPAAEAAHRTRAQGGQP
jgi:DNA-binding transcriptional regulator YdaS (Cro superfamily)